MQVKGKTIKEMVRSVIKTQLKEVVGDTNEDKELHSYLDKMDKLMEDCRISLAELAEEGEELMRSDTSKKERLEIMVMVVGAVKKCQYVMTQSIEWLKKHTG